MKKKILAVLMATTMVFGLAACGSSNSESTGESTEAAAEEFNPDNAEDAMTIEELREANGAEVKVASGLKLGVVMKSLSNEFWRTLQEGYEVAQKDAGVEIEIEATTDESDETGQQTMTETLVSQGVDALMLSPISDSNLTAAVENANSAGIPTINVDDGLIAEANIFVGPNAYQSGYLAAEWVSEQLGDEGQVAIVIGMAKAFAARERTAGFKAWIEDNNSGLELVAEQNADWDLSLIHI